MTSVTKQLACMEDLAQGRGELLQTRGGVEVPLHKLDLGVSVTSTAELTALDGAVFDRAQLYYAAEQFISVAYRANDTSGLLADDTTGSWHVTDSCAITIRLPSTAVPVAGGIWQAGKTFATINDYMIFNGIAYVPKEATVLPYASTTTPDLAQLEPYSSGGTAATSYRSINTFDPVAQSTADFVAEVGHYYAVKTDGSAPVAVDVPVGPHIGGDQVLIASKNQGTPTHAPDISAFQGATMTVGTNVVLTFLSGINSWLITSSF